MKQKKIAGLLILIALAAMLLAFTTVPAAVPVVRVKPNNMVSVRCVGGQVDEVLVDFTPDGVDVTCRVWVGQDEQ